MVNWVVCAGAPRVKWVRWLSMKPDQANISASIAVEIPVQAWVLFTQRTPIGVAMGAGIKGWDASPNLFFPDFIMASVS